jgi:hypothetical protein
MYMPAEGQVAPSPENSHVVVDRVVLLHEPLAGASNVKLAAEFIRKAESAIIAAIPPQKPAVLPQGCGLIAQFRIPKVVANSFEVMFVLPSQEALSAVPMTEMQEVVNLLEVPDGIVYGDYLEFQVLFSCWGFKWDTASVG